MRKQVSGVVSAPVSPARNPGIDFMGKSGITTVLSAAVVLACLVSLLIKGLVLGLDFSSGIAIRLAFEQPVTPGPVNEVLAAEGIDEAQVVNFGSDRVVRILLKVQERNVPDQAAEAVAIGERLTILLSESSGQQVTLLGSDFVSAKAGAEMAEKGGMGLLVSIAMILVYISVRFQFKFAVGAVIALIHDVVITVGFFSLFGLPFDLQVLAGLLAVIGYSLNDTIIVADRIRENFRRLRTGTPRELINLSVNQTLSRTLVTSGTTLMVVIVMLLMGGEAIRGFAIALLIGIGVGTYSSIYIASAALLYLGLRREDLMVPVREESLADMRP
jgi:preprotein translocase subunit SecF